MSLTDLRASLDAVSDAVSVPPPDPAAVETRVRRLRRRRTTVRVVGAAAAVVVAAGASVGLAGHDGAERRPPVTHDVRPARTAAAVPVVVEGRLRMVGGDGTLGAPGPAVAKVVGTTSDGVVVLTDDGTLAAVDASSGSLRPLVAGPVRTAYLDGDSVVYEDRGRVVHWLASSRTEPGRLMAAGDGMAVVAEDSGLVLHDGAGDHDLFLEPGEVQAIRGVDVGGGVVAVRTDAGIDMFWDHGLYGGGLPGDRLGALAPDGHTYAWQTASRQGVELLDPRALSGTAVDGPSGTVSGIGWSPDGDLLVVVDHGNASTLWRCGSDGSACAGVVDDPTGTLSLH